MNLKRMTVMTIRMTELVTRSIWPMAMQNGPESRYFRNENSI